MTERSTTGAAADPNDAFDEEDVDRRMTAIHERQEQLAERIRVAGGKDVTVLAVSKGHPVEAAIAGCRLGMKALGENYAQELRAKAEVMAAGHDAQWHFIGQLQTNKVRMIADSVAVWQSVDRNKVGREIAKRAPGATVYAQVNLSLEAQKAGCSFDDLDELVAQLHELGLNVGGLMGVGSAASELETARGFAQLRAAADRLGLANCSMGMTADLELAIREGATMVRIGTDLFGPRP